MPIGLKNDVRRGSIDPAKKNPDARAKAEPAFREFMVLADKLAASGAPTRATIMQDAPSAASALRLHMTGFKAADIDEKDLRVSTPKERQQAVARFQDAVAQSGKLSATQLAAVKKALARVKTSSDVHTFEFPGPKGTRGQLLVAKVDGGYALVQFQTAAKGITGHW